MSMELAILIVNYNTGHLLDRCLDSIFSQEVPCRVVVVDNASGDDSLAVLARRSDPIEVIDNQENVGFAAASNQALARCGEPLVFFLNPDTELYPGCLRAICSYMEHNPAVGLAGCAVYNPDGTRHETVRHRYPGHSYSQGRFSRLPGEIAWLLGAALVGRREALAATGGFDTDYFLYAEDIDLCLRMRQAGYPLGLIEEAGVMHLEGQSELKAPIKEMLERKIRAELLFYEKHYPAAIRARIRRVRLLEAYWRIFSLQFTGLLPGKAAQRSEKLLRYETVRELYANWGREQ